MILALVLPLRIVAVVGLTAMVALIVRERGDVDGLVWLRSGVLALLAWTVTTQLRSLARSSRPRRRGRATTEATEITPLAAVAPQRLVAARRGRPAGATGLARPRFRDVAATASWWILVASVAGICILAAALVTGWMVHDLSSGGAGPWLVGQILLLGGAVFALGWTMWMAVRSVADLGSRRRRPLVQRFLNWLVRLLSLNRAPVATSAAPSPVATAAGGAQASASSVVRAVVEPGSGVFFLGHRVVASALVASAAMIAGAAGLAESSEAQPPSASAVAAAAATVDGALPASTPLVPPAGDPGDSPPPPAEPIGAAVVAGAAASPPPTSSTPGSSMPTTPPPPAAAASPLASPASPPPTAPTLPPTTTTTTTSPPPTTSTTTTPPPTTSTAPPTPPTTTTSTTPPPTTTTTMPPRTTSTTTTLAPTTTSTPPGCGSRGVPDTDCDGIADAVEIAYGSDPDDRASTPEGRTWDTQTDGRTCTDRVDNDADGRTDAADPGCSG